ncbi:hypothetical protein [Spirillospora sp. NPDC029432]|uniref:hypothetical protein n=1 Tax=Spirillospora sp. NPDC029432 TaxID=3154599 RepID=UPI0034511DC8
MERAIVVTGREGSAVRPARAVALGAPAPEQCVLRIDGATAKTIDVTYGTLPGNQPKAYRNTLAVWESSVIPWTVRPLVRVRLAQNVESGLETISGLEVTRSAYTVAYCTGPDVTDACACAVLAAGGAVEAPTSVSVAVDEIGDRSLSIHYRTLYGYLPRTYRNWVGLWPGLASPYNAPAPMALAKPTDASEGRLEMDGLDLTADTTYTLIYFMDASQTTAAAVHTFRTTT